MAMTLKELITLAEKTDRRPADVPDECVPRVLPVAWHRRSEGVYESHWGLRVLVSCCIERDGRRWLHVSVSRATKIPSWSDLREVKDIFVGRDRLAIQILPPEAEYVNFHPHVLHLWSCLDGERPVPDFRSCEGML